MGTTVGRFLFGWLACTLVGGCTRARPPLGSADNPIKFFFIPSVDSNMLEDTSRRMKSFLERTTPYHFTFAIPASYIAVVEAFGSNRVDLAALNTYGYVLAHEKFGAEARLIPVRYGETTYRGEWLARTSSNIKSLADLAGKKIAFVDPASVSGYLLPLKGLRDQGIKPKQTMFAMRHDSVISMIYQRQVDAGAAFYSPPEKGVMQDARRLVKGQYPDVEKKIKIVALTEPIPNDPIVFRRDMPEDLKNQLAEALIAFSKTPDGIEILQKLSSITGMIKASDHDFDAARDTIKKIGQVDVK